MNQGRNNYGTIRLCPHIMQYAIDKLPLILLNIAGYVCGGMDVFPLKGLLLGISILLSAYLLYLSIYIRKMDFVVTGEQLIHEHGVLVRDSDYIELYRVVDFKENRSFLQQLAGLKTVSVYSAVRMKDVEEAQQKIVNIIRKLEDSGEIVISRGGGDEIVV